jgi:hypothetical protein
VENDDDPARITNDAALGTPNSTIPTWPDDDSGRRFGSRAVAVLSEAIHDWNRPGSAAPRMTVSGVKFGRLWPESQS